MNTMSIYHWGKHSLLTCLLCLLLASCAKGIDPKILQEVSNYHTTIHTEYVATYVYYNYKLKQGDFALATSSITQFIDAQNKASVFWTSVVLPPELEGYRAQILDSFSGTKPIEARYEQFSEAYKAILTALFPDGVIASPSK